MRLALESAVYGFQYYLQMLDLIQDLRGETSPSRVKVSTDGKHVIATGIYPPQVNVQLRAIKFERHLISEIINFQHYNAKMVLQCSKEENDKMQALSIFTSWLSVEEARLREEYMSVCNDCNMFPAMLHNVLKEI